MKDLSIKTSFCIMIFTLLVSCEKPDDGLTSLIEIDTEIAGINCDAGGYKIETGIDKNGNGVLDPDEVQDSAYICHGSDGIDGSNIVFGETQTGLKVDTVYHAYTDGILIILYERTNGGNFVGGYIYSDQDENPSTVVGISEWTPSTVTLFIPKGNYWRVARPIDNIGKVDVSISWTPIHN
jgi:hypothetical protein